MVETINMENKITKKFDFFNKSFEKIDWFNKDEIAHVYLYHYVTDK